MGMSKRFCKSFLLASLFALSSTLSSVAWANEPASVRFAVPPWTGTTVKSHLAATLLDTLGYTTRQRELGVAVVYQGLAQNELDVFMGAWLPSQQGMYDSSMQGDDTLLDLGSNVDGAQLGFVVPTYIFDTGITSANDLCNKDLQRKAGGVLYSIEAGSGTSDLLADMQKNRTYCLDEWRLSETSEAAMFGQAKATMDRDEWIVFYAWTPHWATVEYDIKFLDDPKNAWGPDGGHSDVLTLVANDFGKSNPNATRLLDQLVFSAEDESAMIRMHGYEEQTVDEAARTWMRNHPDKLKGYLDGVTTRDGQPAWPVVQQALQIPDA